MSTACNVGTVHATAMARTGLSRPLRIALDTGLIEPGATSVFDYGCGRGDDLRLLRRRGVSAHGWDPTSRPKAPKVPADVVNLGYVINVIRDPAQRANALTHAWRLARSVMIVAARLTSEMSQGLQPAGDGYTTAKGTFQKFFTQAELRAWIDTTLEVDSIAMAPGVFAVFREERAAQTWLAARRRRAATLPGISVRDNLYDAHQPLLERLQGFVAERGRLPAPDEVPWEAEIDEALGSFARAWQVVRHATGNASWDDIREQRTAELCVHLALSRLRRRPRFGQLPLAVQADIRAFFGSYKHACEEADALLRGAGDLTALRATAVAAPVGKRTATDLYLHVDAVDTLPPLLQVYEGCAHWVAGHIDGATLVKLSWEKPKVSYLAYPDFDRDPHPALAAAAVVRLDELSVELRSYTERANPPILHRKETFVPDDYPGREKFARLTRQEERAGLLSDPQIGTRGRWQDVLDTAGLKLRGHRLIKK